MPHEASTSAELDLADLWFCPHCGDVHGAPPCPSGERWFLENPSRLDSGVRLCACCARVALPSGSPFASFFCATCGPLVVEVNRSLGRLAVPVCRDLDANLAMLPSSDATRPDVSPSDRRSFFASQLDLLERAGCLRARFLIDRLRLPDEPIELERYLREVVQLRHESFHAEAALRQLVDRFHEYVVQIPSESPALAAQVKQRAREFARGFRRDTAARMRAKGPAFLKEVAWEWIRRERIDAQPLPPCVPSDQFAIQARLGQTRIALVDEAVRDFERVFGPVKRPLAPTMPPGFVPVALARAGEEWPENFPDACPVKARLVVGLEDAPAYPELPVVPYHLSMDRQHRWWILWGVVDDDEEGYLSSAPVAWGPRSGLDARDAGFLLLAVSLKKDRETHGPDRPRPDFGMPGLLDEDLTGVLLDLVWPPE